MVTRPLVRRRRRRACDGTLAAETLEQAGRIRHFRGVNQTQKRHLRRFARIRRHVDILKGLEQHLPEAVDRAP